MEKELDIDRRRRAGYSGKLRLRDGGDWIGDESSGFPESTEPKVIPSQKSAGQNRLKVLTTEKLNA